MKAGDVVGDHSLVQKLNLIAEERGDKREHKYHEKAGNGYQRPFCDDGAHNRAQQEEHRNAQTKPAYVAAAPGVDFYH